MSTETMLAPQPGFRAGDWGWMVKRWPRSCWHTALPAELWTVVLFTLNRILWKVNYTVTLVIKNWETGWLVSSEKRDDGFRDDTLAWRGAFTTVFKKKGRHLLYNHKNVLQGTQTTDSFKGLNSRILNFHKHFSSHFYWEIIDTHKLS